MLSNRILPYPEGTACAEVLLAAGDGAGAGGSRGISAGMGISALAKLLTDGLGIVPGTVAAKIGALRTEFSAEAYPSLVGMVAAGGGNGCGCVASRAASGSSGADGHSCKARMSGREKGNVWRRGRGTGRNRRGRSRWEGGSGR